MTVEYSSRFIKDLKALKGTPSFDKIKEIAFEFTPSVETVDEIPHFSKMEGYDNYYRIREGDYRMGLKIDDNILVFYAGIAPKRDISLLPINDKT